MTADAAPRRPVLLVAGPTASGKSGLALHLAEDWNGVVINADSLQVYEEIPTLTARPSAEDEARRPHRLYGILKGTDLVSAGSWRARALAEIDQAHAAGQVPIIVGGTGLYLNALTTGLSPIPDVSDPVRREATDLLHQIGVAALFEKLAHEDPATAANIDRQNPARVLRAWEILRQTGRPLIEWQAAPPEGPPAHLGFMKLLISPPRDALYASGDKRFRKMIALGALDEVRALMALDYPDDAPVKKALGYRPMESHLKGEITLEEAALVSERDTRRYAKRQMTWFRNQYQPNETLFAQYSESLDPENRQNIRQFLLTTQI